ncbi:sigma-54-dependent Fis family transcriptional regulator [bacterium]|nr:sigma-54-dependent Fis family transcriptional regulator [bacterium]
MTATKNKILVIDDEKSMLEFLSIMLTKDGFSVATSDKGQEGINMFKKTHFDLVITDIKMSKVSGIDVLKSIRSYDTSAVVLMITAYASVDTAIEAMKLGAFDYITKPFKIEEIRVVIRKALQQRKLLDENINLKNQLKSEYDFGNIIGSSLPIMDVFDKVRKISHTDATVILYGETGTGKELFARAIHYNSHRKSKPFISVDCGALTETLLESELFGHVKGSFTGAIEHKKGLFEAAHGGTIFLDEVGVASPQIQTKLLRVLQEHEIKRVGGNKNIKVDVRVIAATNTDLEQQIKDGKFREDLFYRLSVIPIVLPPLRERIDDIPLLVSHFLKKYARKAGSKIKKMLPEVVQILMKYNWPGNIRELENVIERAVILEDGDIIAIESLPDKLREWEMEIDEKQIIEGGLKNTIDQTERNMILKAFKECAENQYQTAKKLKVSRQNLQYKLKKYRIINVVTG